MGWIPFQVISAKATSEIDLRAQPPQVALEPTGDEPAQPGLIRIGLDEARRSINRCLQRGAIG